MENNAILDQRGDGLIGAMVGTVVITAGITALVVMSNHLSKNVNNLEVKRRYTALVQNINQALLDKKHCDGNFAGAKFKIAANGKPEKFKGQGRQKIKNHENKDELKVAIKLFDQDKKETASALATEGIFQGGLETQSIDVTPLAETINEGTQTIPATVTLSSKSFLPGNPVFSNLGEPTALTNELPIYVYLKVVKTGDEVTVKECIVNGRTTASDASGPPAGGGDGQTPGNGATGPGQTISGDLKINGKLLISDVGAPPFEGACLVSDYQELGGGAIQVRKLISWIKPQVLSVCNNEAMAKCENGKIYYKGLMACPSDWTETLLPGKNQTQGATCEGGKHSMSVGPGGISKWGKKYRCSGSAAWVN